jgi:PKD repeat protein
VLFLTACGGGGGGGGEEPSNLSPIALATATPQCGSTPLTVTFDGSGSNDPDGTIATYAWSFGDSSTGSGSRVTHSYAAGGTFTATLTVTDNRGARAATSVEVTAVAGPVPAAVNVAGRISFERVPFSTTGQGLDYNGTFEAPAREVEVELLRASDLAVLATVVTDAQGRYRLSAPVNTGVRVRAKALSRPSAGSAAQWRLRVLNNTNSDALYVLDGASFDTCVLDHTRDLKATTGWGGNFAGVYTGTRAAAPFAILDTLYSAAQLVVQHGDPAVQLGSLDAFWSPSNRPSSSWNPSNGDIETTQYVTSGGSAPGIYVLGTASNDTDEFDAHIVAHEFFHFLEDAVSRADTVGGDHSLDERLDLRVSFSEGFGNAYAAMVLDDPLYRDSYGVAQGSDFRFDIERDAGSAPGWYSERSVHRIAWDLFDPANEPGDAVDLGFAPIYDVLRAELRTGVPLVSLFPFITALKQRPGVPIAAIDARVEAEQVAGTSQGIDSVAMNAYATTETHSGVAASSADLVLPVYAPVTVNGPGVRICGSSAITAPDGSNVPGVFNKLGNRRLLRFSVPAAQAIRIRVTCLDTDPSCTGLPTPDPDFVLSRGTDRTVSEDETPRVEQRDVAATAGDYVLEVYEYSHVDTAATSRRGRTCMTVNITG